MTEPVEEGIMDDDDIVAEINGLARQQHALERSHVAAAFPPTRATASAILKFGSSWPGTFFASGALFVPPA